MRKKHIIILMIAINCFLLFAYDNSMYNVKTPLNLDNGILEILIKHDFYGKFYKNGKLADDMLDTFLETEKGASVSIGARYVVLENSEIEILKQMYPSNIKIGLGRTINIGALNIEGYVQRTFGKSEIANFYLLSMGFENVFQLWNITVNAGYNEEKGYLGLGTGLSLQLNDKLSTFVEYFPLISENNKYSGKTAAFNTGVKIITLGHQFYISLGNNYATDMNSAMLGTTGDDLNLGFKISRMIEF